MHDIVENWT
jgi:hypothetical protein